MRASPLDRHPGTADAIWRKSTGGIIHRIQETRNGLREGIGAQHLTFETRMESGEPPSAVNEQCGHGGRNARTDQAQHPKRDPYTAERACVYKGYGNLQPKE